MIPLPSVYLGYPQPEPDPEKHEAEPCLICRKPVKKPARHWVHLGSGGSHLVTDEEAAKDPGGDMGWFPVGPECWRSRPQVHAYGIDHGRKK